MGYYMIMGLGFLSNLIYYCIYYGLLYDNGFELFKLPQILMYILSNLILVRNIHTLMSTLMYSKKYLYKKIYLHISSYTKQKTASYIWVN
jgi:hypothetical protein